MLYRDNGLDEAKMRKPYCGIKEQSYVYEKSTLRIVNKEAFFLRNVRFVIRKGTMAQKKIEGLQIRPLREAEDLPMDILLLADPNEDMVREYCSEGRVYIAEIGTIAVGVIAGLRTRPGCFEIMNVAVLTEYQNRGIGRSLVEYALERAKEDGYRSAEIGTGNPGVQQMLLYQKCGFRIVGVEFDFFRRYCKEPIFENGIECRDMIRMSLFF